MCRCRGHAKELFYHGATACREAKTETVYWMCEMWAVCFCGHPCQTNEPAELAGGIGGSVDWSRADQSRESSLVHWACNFPVGGPAMAAEQLLTTSESVSAAPLWVPSRKRPPAESSQAPKELRPLATSDAWTRSWQMRWWIQIMYEVQRVRTGQFSLCSSVCGVFFFFLSLSPCGRLALYRCKLARRPAVWDVFNTRNASVFFLCLSVFYLSTQLWSHFHRQYVL